jgi:hypothetical protein
MAKCHSIKYYKLCKISNKGPIQIHRKLSTTYTHWCTLNQLFKSAPLTKITPWCSLPLKGDSYTAGQENFLPLQNLKLHVSIQKKNRYWPCLVPDEPAHAFTPYSSSTIPSTPKFLNWPLHLTDFYQKICMHFSFPESVVPRPALSIVLELIKHRTIRRKAT